MTFDNGKTLITLRLRVFIATVFLLIYIYFAFLGKELKFPVIGLSAASWTLILFSLYGFLSFYPMLFKYRYIYFSDDGPKLIFRFYAVGMIKGSRSSVEIPKSEFAGYKIGTYSAVFKNIILSRKIDRKIVQYPPIYLGALSRKEIEKITTTLDLIDPVK